MQNLQAETSLCEGAVLQKMRKTIICGGKGILPGLRVRETCFPTGKGAFCV